MAFLSTRLKRRPPSWIGFTRAVLQCISRCASCHAAADGNHIAVRSRLRTAHASHGSEIAVLLAADIIFQTYFIAQIVDEARAEILRVVIGIVDGDDILKLSRADFANPLGGRL